MNKFLRSLRCFLGFHDLHKERSPVIRVWHAHCRQCGATFVGEYDMAYGHTHWKRR